MAKEKGAIVVDTEISTGCEVCIRPEGFHLYLFELAFINQFYISSKYFDMACYWKQEAYTGPISFEIVKWQLNWFIWDASSSSTTLVTRAIVELTRLKFKWKGN